MMKRYMKYLNAIWLSGILLVSCVDDYTDANLPRLLDAPAVSSVAIADDEIRDGTSTQITVVVVDAPAGLDSVAVTALDENEDEVGEYSIETAYEGMTAGDIEITYTAPEQTTGLITITVTVFDRQVRPNGDVVQKSSVPKSVGLQVFCEPPLVGTYTVLGEFLVDDFNSPDVVTDQVVTTVDCAWAYAVEDLTGGLYTTTYATNYGTVPVAAEINIDPDTNLISWEGVSDQFGGEIVQDPAQPGSYFDPENEQFVIYWTATAFGERGIATFTKQ